MLTGREDGEEAVLYVRVCVCVTRCTSNHGERNTSILQDSALNFIGLYSTAHTRPLPECSPLCPAGAPSRDTTAPRSQGSEYLTTRSL